MTSRIKTLTIKRKALTLLEVLKETGRINMKEAHRRHYPNQNEASHSANAANDMMTPEVYEKFIKLLRVDDDAIAKLGPETVIKDILDDIHKLNLLIEAPDVNRDEVAKLINAKTNKQKLLGSYLSIWNQDKSVDTKDSDPDFLFGKSSRFGLN